jgi:simple sugar transport system permease protein
MSKISTNFTNILIPVFAALMGLLFGALIMLFSGYDPVLGYTALFEGMFGTPRAFGETIRAMTPLILAGIAVGFAFRTGLFNIGVEGQALVGWLAAVWVGVALDLPKPLHVTIAILVAAVAGALWGFIPGLLKGRFGVNEVIVTIMLNYTALYLTSYLIKRYIFAGNEKSENIKESASLQSPWLSEQFGFSRIHYGIFIALLMAIVMWYILEKTTLGYELRSVGFNKHASQYAGMNVNNNIMYSMMISGGFAGIAGSMEGLGTFGNMTALTHFTGIGFDGIAVSLLGGNTAIGIVVSALLFGGLNSAAPSMNFNADVPSELVRIIIALIIFFVASSYVIKYLISKYSKEDK